MPIPLASMQPSIFSSDWPTLDQPFGAINVSPRQENLGRKPHSPMPMTNPCPYGTSAVRPQYCPVPTEPMTNPGFDGYQGKTAHRPSVSPPHPPLSHDAPSLNAIVRAFNVNPRAKMSPSTPREIAAYGAAYSYRFRNGRKYELDDDFPPTPDLLRKVANWLVTSDFDASEDVKIKMCY